jgi:large subunit ribosomal protein L11
VLIKQALKLKSGSAVPHRDKVGQLTDAQITEIAEKKMPDLNANDIEAAKAIIAGTARSMGVTVQA